MNEHRVLLRGGPRDNTVVTIGAGTQTLMVPDAETLEHVAYRFTGKEEEFENLGILPIWEVEQHVHEWTKRINSETDEVFCKLCKEVYKDPRPSWDEYFAGIAEAVAQRATCTRAKVGALLVSADHRILATGYNGSAPGEPHCIDVGCDVVDNHCQRTQHAEVNAVAFAARHGVSIAGSRLYLWINSDGTATTVCRECAKVLKAAGVTW